MTRTCHVCQPFYPPLCCASLRVSHKGVGKPVCMKMFTEQSWETNHSILVEATKLLPLNGCDNTPWCYSHQPDRLSWLQVPGHRNGVHRRPTHTLHTINLCNLVCTLEKRPGNVPKPDWKTFAKTLAAMLQCIHQCGIVINDPKEDAVMLR